MGNTPLELLTMLVSFAHTYLGIMISAEQSNRNFYQQF